MKLMLNDTKIFCSLLCYYNVNDYYFFKVAKCSSIKDVVQLSVVFIILQK
jgi:hypothetical protein